MGTQQQKYNQLLNYIKPELQIILKQALLFSSITHKTRNDLQDNGCPLISKHYTNPHNNRLGLPWWCSG